MFLAHSFRLRDPWQCECAHDGTVCYSRGFHRPTGIEEDDALWLVCSLMPADAQVTLNGQQLATPIPPRDNAEVPPNEFEVTHLIADTNKIEIRLPSISGSTPSTSFPFDVRLGIVGHS